MFSVKTKEWPRKETDMKSLILLAAGEGRRMNAGKNKVLLTIGGKSLIRLSAEAFLPFADAITVVYRAGEEEIIREELSFLPNNIVTSFVEGGQTRQESVLHALKSMRNDPPEIVMIHDSARCAVDAETIRLALLSTEKYGSGVPCLPMTDTVKVSSDKATVDETPDRSTLFRAQTPQCFRWDLILEAYLNAETESWTGTDDASLAEHAGKKVYMTPGAESNLKITVPEDLNSFSPAVPFRIGHGYDVHCLVPDRKLILCGIEVPHTLGLLGHSDADVALHALMDAILGAMGLWDIGHFFPDTDMKYKDISSMVLLEEVMAKVREKNAKIVNCDITIVAQKPKLSTYIPEMRKNVAKALGCDESCVNVKATTTEKLGFEGEELGISAQAVCLIAL